MMIAIYDLADVCCAAGHVCAAIESPGPGIYRIVRVSGRSIQQKRMAQYCPTIERVLAAETRIDYTQLRPIKAVALVNLLLYCTSHSSSTIWESRMECCSPASRATAHQQFDKVINVRDLSNIYSNIMITTLTFYLLFYIIWQNLVGLYIPSFWKCWRAQLCRDVYCPSTVYLFSLAAAADVM